MVSGSLGSVGGESGLPLITFTLNYDALQDFVVQTNARFKQHDKRIAALEKQVSQVAQRNVELEVLLKERQEEIIVLRSEVGVLTTRVTDTEEQNKALREENALAFTKITKKLESSATSEGLQKEMLSLKEGTDNRMLILENMMRDVGGDKMRALVRDVGTLQHDSIALWKENARIILEIEQRAHADQAKELLDMITGQSEEIKAIQVFTNEAAQEARRAEMDKIRALTDKVQLESENASKLVRAAVDRTDRALLAKKETDGFVDRLREELSVQSKGLSEAQNLVRALLGAQKRFAVELDEVVTKTNRRSAFGSSSMNLMADAARFDAEAADIMMGGNGSNNNNNNNYNVTLSAEDEERAHTNMGFFPSGSQQNMPSFPPGRVRRPQSAAAMVSARGGASLTSGPAPKSARQGGMSGTLSSAKGAGTVGKSGVVGGQKAQRPQSVGPWGRSSPPNEYGRPGSPGFGAGDGIVMMGVPPDASGGGKIQPVSQRGGEGGKRLHPLPTDLLMDVGPPGGGGRR